MPQKITITMDKTSQQYDHVIGVCQDIFSKKMQDYGISWRILRPSSMTDQIYIKAQRIRSIEQKGISKIDEGVRSDGPLRERAQGGRQASGQASRTGHVRHACLRARRVQPRRLPQHGEQRGERDRDASRKQRAEAGGQT